MIFQTLLLAASICLPTGKELGYSEKIYEQSKSLSCLAQETYNFNKVEAFSTDDLELVIEKGFIDCDLINKNRDQNLKDNIQKYFIESGKKSEAERIEKESIYQGLVNGKSKENFDNSRLCLFDVLFEFESILRKEDVITFDDDSGKDNFSYSEVDDKTIQIEEKKEEGRDYITDFADNLEYDPDNATVISGGYLDGKEFNGYVLSADFCRLVFNTLVDFLESVLATTLSALGIYAILTKVASGFASIIAAVATKIGSIIGSLLSHLFAIPYVGPILFGLLLIASIGSALVLAKILVAAYFGYGFAIGFKGSVWTWDLEWVCDFVE